MPTGTAQKDVSEMRAGKVGEGWVSLSVSLFFRAVIPAMPRPTVGVRAGADQVGHQSHRI